MSNPKKNNHSHKNQAHLLIIGGGEDKQDNGTILSRFVEMAGGASAKIIVLSAASTAPDAMWKTYDRVFKKLGVAKRVHLDIRTRKEAEDPAHTEEIMSADGIFITGGDQKRLLATVGGTATAHAMHKVFRTCGICIAGTSAGASAMSEHMIASSSKEEVAEKQDTHLAAGLGFLPRIIIDQHFSERHRLGRLLGIVAQNPYLLGVGIDEDTALCVERGAGIEVIGRGAVTLIDGRHMTSDFLEATDHERMQLLNVKLHLLPAGTHYCNRQGCEKNIPKALVEAFDSVTTVTRSFVHS